MNIYIANNTNKPIILNLNSNTEKTIAPKERMMLDINDDKLCISLKHTYHSSKEKNDFIKRLMEHFHCVIDSNYQLDDLKCDDCFFINARSVPQSDSLFYDVFDFVTNGSLIFPQKYDVHDTHNINKIVKKDKLFEGIMKYFISSLYGPFEFCAIISIILAFVVNIKLALKAFVAISVFYAILYFVGGKIISLIVKKIDLADDNLNDFCNNEFVNNFLKNYYRNSFQNIENNVDENSASSRN